MHIVAGLAAASIIALRAVNKWKFHIYGNGKQRLEILCTLAFHYLYSIYKVYYIDSYFVALRTNANKPIRKHTEH